MGDGYIMTDTQQQELLLYVKRFIKADEDVEIAMDRIQKKLDADDSAPTDPDQFMKFAKMIARSECLNLVSEIVKRDKETGAEEEEDISKFFPGAEDAVKRAQSDYEERHKEEKKRSEEDEEKLNTLAAVAACIGVASVLALNIWNIINKHKQK